MDARTCDISQQTLLEKGARLRARSSILERVQSRGPFRSHYAAVLVLAALAALLASAYDLVRSYLLAHSPPGILEHFLAVAAAALVAVGVSHRMLRKAHQLRRNTFLQVRERNMAEATLRKKNAFQQPLLDAIPVPVFYKDSNARYLGCNAAFARIVGRRPDEIVGKTVYDLAPREKADVYHAQDKALLENPGVQIYEHTIHAADGSERRVVFHKATFRDAKGKVGGIVGAILDITDRKRAEEALEQSRAELEAVFRDVPIPMVLLDRDRRVRKVNLAAVNHAAGHAFGLFRLAGSHAVIERPCEQGGGNHS